MLSDAVGDRHSLLIIGMVAVGAACLIFAITRLATTLTTGKPTPWWANATGAAAMLAIYAWYRRSPGTRSGGAVHATATVATIALLIPVAYGMSSTIWWLSLVAFAMILLGRRREAMLWGTGIPFLVLAVSLAEPFVQVENATGENSLERMLAKTVFVVLIAGLATGFRAVANRRAIALHESEERFRSQSEATFEGTAVCREGRILDANRQLAEMLGLDRAELIGRNIAQYVTPGALDFVMECDRSDHDGPYECLFLRKDGTTFPVEMRGRKAYRQGQAEHLIAIRDITERKQAEQALRESEERFKMLVENTDDFVMLTHADGRRLYVSPSYFTATGWTMEEIQQTDWRARVHPEDLPAVEKVREANLAGEPTVVEYRSLCKDGSWIWVEARCRPLASLNGHVQEMVLVSRDITARKEDQARRDLLTGLPNRFLFYEAVGGAIGESRLGGGCLAVLLVNLDRFEEVNESRDHSVGDLVLQAIARKLAGALKDGALLARMGGDEFAVLLRDEKSSKAAGATATELLDVIAAPLLLAGQEFHLTASIGISLYPADGDSAGALMRSADLAMRRSRRTGGGAYQFVTPDMATAASERLLLKEGLRKAIAGEELALHYQPLVDITSGSVVAMEALVRWHHPRMGLLLPDLFIGLAEESALIHPVGQWVLHTACKQCQAWRAQGNERLSVAVNLSPRQFLQADLADSVRGVLEAVAMPPESLILEITEGTAMWDMDQTVIALRALRELGARIAIDDFGKGYSSLAYLKRFPIDFIKIDRSFIQDVVLEPDDAAIVISLISMAHGLNLKVVAEGVESAEQMEFLRHAGCDIAQGYFVRHPAPPDEFGGLLRTLSGAQ